MENQDNTQTTASRIMLATEKFPSLNAIAKNDLLTDIMEINFKDDDHFNSYLERKEKTFGDLIKVNKQEIDNICRSLGLPYEATSEANKPDSEKKIDEIMKSME